MVEEKTIKNFYRLVPREKSLFKDCKELYSGVVISAHLAAYFNNSTKPFLNSLEKPFFVDPMTYVFGRNLDNISREDGNIKKSFERLAECYGNTLRRTIMEDKRALNPKDFRDGRKWNEELLNELCKNVLVLQKDLVERWKITPLDKLLEYAGKRTDKKTKGLLFLAAPYFFASSITDEWYEISRQLAVRSLDFKEKNKLYPVICISKGMLLREKTICKIKEDYKEFDGLVIWISDFNDTKEGIEQLKGLKKFISIMNENGKPIYSLYGGYFFALLSKFGLTGYSSAICYGESRDVDTHPTGGGFPLRYYVPFLRVKVPEIDARTFYVDYPSLLCDCKVCTYICRLIENASKISRKSAQYIDIFFNNLNDESTRKHFLECRYKELVSISQNKVQTLIEQLNKELKNQENFDLSSYHNFNNMHIRNWIDTLSDYKEYESSNKSNLES